jgi:hypothetical protein
MKTAGEDYPKLGQSRCYRGETNLEALHSFPSTSSQIGGNRRRLCS